MGIDIQELPVCYSSPRRARNTPTSLFLRLKPPPKPVLGKPFAVSGGDSISWLGIGTDSGGDGCWSCSAMAGNVVLWGGGVAMDGVAVETECLDDRDFFLRGRSLDGDIGDGGSGRSAGCICEM